MKAVNFMTVLPMRFFVVLFASLALLTTACEQAPDVIDEIAEDETEIALTEADVEHDYEEVATVSIEALEREDYSSFGRDFSGMDNSLLTHSGCPTITRDTVNKKITIDFGTSCVGPDGKTRSGKIIITYTRRLYHPGASLKIELENYVVDGKQIEGTKTIENVSTSYRDDISLKTTLRNGQITWPDSTSATRQYTRTRTWIRAPRPINDEFHVEGRAQGTRRNGNSYSVNIVSTIIYKRKCRMQGIHIPVQGLKLIKRTGHPDLLIDFGDGDCDHLITLTRNGNSRVVDVRNRN